MSNDNKKPLLFTGITATGTLTLGHYIGVIQHLVKLQEKYQIFLMIADLHALTTISEKRIPYDDRTREITALLYACGLREENCKIFVQSQVSAHLELAYFLSSYCSTGRIVNMIQYKQKSGGSREASLSLLSYPVLMASDILLYEADLVIVGRDQKQHLELASYLAGKFNANNNNYLKVPTFLIPEQGSKIMGLRDPLKKMSKTSSDYIGILDSDEEITRKVMRAETDSEATIYYDEQKKPGVTNLLTIYSQLGALDTREVERQFLASSYNQLKLALIELLKNSLEPVRKSFAVHYERVDQVLAKNNCEIRQIATERIRKIKKNLSLWGKN